MNSPVACKGAEALKYAPKRKPAHLGVQYAEQFQDMSVVQAYQYRASFPSEVFTKLLI